MGEQKAEAQGRGGGVDEHENAEEQIRIYTDEQKRSRVDDDIVRVNNVSCDGS